MSHANAALTPRARLRLAKLIVEEGWPVAVAAKMFLVSPPTARKWAARYRAEGPAGSAEGSVDFLTALRSREDSHHAEDLLGGVQGQCPGAA